MSTEVDFTQPMPMPWTQFWREMRRALLEDGETGLNEVRIRLEELGLIEYSDAYRDTWSGVRLLQPLDACLALLQLENSEPRVVTSNKNFRFNHAYPVVSHETE